MAMAAADAKVWEWNQRFRKTPLARSVVTRLHERSAEIWKQTFELLQRESPEYRNSVDDEFTKKSKGHCRNLLTVIIAVAAGPQKKAAIDPFACVRTHAVWRARHQV